MSDAPSVVPLGVTAVLARFGDRIDADLTRRIARVVDWLDGGVGIVDLVPSYTTLLVLFDPDRTTPDAVTAQIAAGWRASEDNPTTDDPNTPIIEIPVVYGGETGPDLEDVARITGLDPADVARRHSEAEYTVGALGFSPGFAFLIGLPEELATPRRATPRTRVPAGSIGIGGVQTGIYSLPTPGGWNLIGRTPRPMFDPAGSPDTGLRLGDRVRFVPVAAAAEVPAFADVAVDDGVASFADGVLEIVTAGVQTTIQDLGRPGQARAGITPGGALDRAALIAGNRRLGNDDGAAAIEWTLLPPVLRAHAACRVVLTGADPGWMLDGTPLAIGAVVAVASGAELRADPVRQGLGARGYLCVAGGIDVPVVRGSRALDLAAGFGGGYGRPLRAGDMVPVGTPPTHAARGDDGATGRATDPAERPFRVVRGAQADHFDGGAWRALVSEQYTIDAQSNRMGLRLNGPALVPERADLISEGVVTGDIQVTGSGQPIVLLRGRATIGGYPKIATVIEADHDRLGQLPPGRAIRFVELSQDEAVAALRAWHPSFYGGMSSDEESAVSDDVLSDASGDAWTPDGVIRVLREIASQDVRAFSLRVESAGIEIAIDRGGGLPALPARSRADSTSDRDEVYADDPNSEYQAEIVAPLLGTFWRRPAPEQAPYVEIGDRIEAGQVVGTIEVMKSFHEVTAPSAGVVARVLVEDGAVVEFGQLLVALEPAEG